MHDRSSCRRATQLLTVRSPSAHRHAADDGAGCSLAPRLPAAVAATWRRAPCRRCARVRCWRWRRSPLHLGYGALAGALYAARARRIIVASGLFFGLGAVGRGGRDLRAARWGSASSARTSRRWRCWRCRRTCSTARRSGALAPARRDRAPIARSACRSRSSTPDARATRRALR